MKKNMILGIALTLISLQQLNAQDVVQVSPSLAQRFEDSFAGAKNVHWIALPKKITQAQFYYNGASWIAYFDYSGNVITSGRRIKSDSDLPLKVQSGLRRAKARMDKKGGNAQIVMLYEMLKDDATKYFVSLQNETTLATFSISTDGGTVLERQKARIPEPKAKTPKKDVIAKKN